MKNLWGEEIIVPNGRTGRNLKKDDRTAKNATDIVGGLAKQYFRSYPNFGPECDVTIPDKKKGLSPSILELRRKGKLLSLLRYKVGNRDKGILSLETLSVVGDDVNVEVPGWCVDFRFSLKEKWVCFYWWDSERFTVLPFRLLQRTCVKYFAEWDKQKKYPIKKQRTYTGKDEYFDSAHRAVPCTVVLRAMAEVAATAGRPVGDTEWYTRAWESIGGLVNNNKFRPIGRNRFHYT